MLEKNCTHGHTDDIGIVAMALDEAVPIRDRVGKGFEQMTSRAGYSGDLVGERRGGEGKGRGRGR